MVCVIFRLGSVCFDGMECFQELFCNVEMQGCGQIVVMVYFGSWEFVGYMLVVVCEKFFYVFVKLLCIVGVMGFFEEMCECMGVNVLWIGCKLILCDMFGVFWCGEMFGFVMDQKFEVGGGCDVNFFGILILFVVGFGVLMVCMGCLVIVVFCL